MFDIIGDIHSCADELRELLSKLGYPRNDRKLISVGDYFDKGNKPVETANLVMDLFNSDQMIGVLGNHCSKGMRWLQGNKIKPSHGLQDTIDAFSRENQTFRDKVLSFLQSLPIELILDNDKLSVSHAGLPAHLQGKTNGTAKSHALYGATDGTVDAITGYPTRLPWQKDYRGHRIVAHGHIITPQVEVVNNVWSIDQGCYAGNCLTALRYPEMEIVQVKAKRDYTK